MELCNFARHWQQQRAEERRAEQRLAAGSGAAAGSRDNRPPQRRKLTPVVPRPVSSFASAGGAFVQLRLQPEPPQPGLQPEQAEAEQAEAEQAEAEQAEAEQAEAEQAEAEQAELPQPGLQPEQPEAEQAELPQPGLQPEQPEAEQAEAEQAEHAEPGLQPEQPEQAGAELRRLKRVAEQRIFKRYGCASAGSLAQQMQIDTTAITGFHQLTPIERGAWAIGPAGRLDHRFGVRDALYKSVSL